MDTTGIGGPPLVPIRAGRVRELAVSRIEEVGVVPEIRGERVMTGVPRQSPRVLAVSWGHLEVEGLGLSKDVKLFPGGGRSWDWSETGTRHSPGIQPEDVEELLANGATTIILSRGMQLQLDVDPRTLDYLGERQVTVHVAETMGAVRIYNDLVATSPVGGLFHSTC